MHSAFKHFRLNPFCAWALLGILNMAGASFLETSLAAHADDNVRSVMKLNESKPWDRLADSQLSIRVEGRLGSSGGGQFRLLKCEARFTYDANRLKSVPAKSNIEVKGKFKRDGTRVDFVVDDLKVLPSYVAQFDSRVGKLQRPTADDWNELGNWAAERARFYEDDELQKKANEAFLNGIEVEYKALSPTDFEGRLALARKIEEQNLSKRRAMEYLHEGLQVQWLALQKSDAFNPTAWQQFAKTLTVLLPGAKDPLKTVNTQVKDAYEENPIVAYGPADDDLRLQMHRLFFVMVMRKAILFDESSDGHDGDAIADQIDKQIPEEHPLAEKHRLAQLSYRMANLPRETRSEVENLAATLRQRNRNDDAKQALRQWIKSHETKLMSGGVLGRLQLADEYLSLLNDEPAAVENLKEAYSIEPGYEAVKSKLVALGYRWDNVRWTKAEKMPEEQPSSNSEMAALIARGMTATTLRSRLGQPTSLARAFSSRGITEVWCFGPKSSTQLVIRLEQKGHELEPKVTSYYNP